MEARPDLSIVVPVFNGSGTLRELFDGIEQEMKSLQLQFEVVFVDDASTDDSWHIIRELKARHGAIIKGFRLARNSGQQAATYCGLIESNSSWVATIDDDLQPHPRELSKLWNCAQTANVDVVYGVYSTPQQGLAHRVGTRLFRKLLRRIAPQFPDGSSFRLIRSDVTKALPENVGPWVVVDPVLAWHTSTITAIPIEHGGGPTTESRYTLYRLFAMASTLLVTYSVIPLRLMTALGFLSSTTAFGLGIFYLIRKITIGAPLGFSALIVSTTFFSGMILLNLGILGEYISRIHTMGSGQPAFAIKAKV